MIIYDANDYNSDFTPKLNFENTGNSLLFTISLPSGNADVPDGSVIFVKDNGSLVEIGAFNKMILSKKSTDEIVQEALLSRADTLKTKAKEAESSESLIESGGAVESGEDPAAGTD